MKYLFLCLMVILISSRLSAQIIDIKVETYYISDSLDATDTTGVNVLPEHSITYRIYISLQQGYKLKSIFGNPEHTLRIQSTDTIFNNLDRPNAYFGYLINKSWFPSNPTIALDSWLTIGLATKTHQGVLKIEDTDSSFIGGLNNNGGSAEIPGGILTNQDPEAGIALIYEDGLIPSSLSLTQWSDVGFRNTDGEDTTVFGPIQKGLSLISNAVLLQQHAGISGTGPDNNVLLAQITTRGSLQFELNVTLLDSLGNEYTVVAKDPSGNEILSPFLTWPLTCGCKDPHFLEYNSKYACNNLDSCKTKIILGCMDPFACNYDPTANMNVQSLCCYPGLCNDRLLNEVCPDRYDIKRTKKLEITMFPNPASDRLQFSIINNDNTLSTVSIINSLGITEKYLEWNSGNTGEMELDIRELSPGIYLLQCCNGIQQSVKKFIKD